MLKKRNSSRNKMHLKAILLKTNFIYCLGKRRKNRNTNRNGLCVCNCSIPMKVVRDVICAAGVEVFSLNGSQTISVPIRLCELYVLPSCLFGLNTEMRYTLFYQGMQYWKRTNRSFVAWYTNIRFLCWNTMLLIIHFA